MFSECWSPHHIHFVNLLRCWRVTNDTMCCFPKVPWTFKENDNFLQWFTCVDSEEQAFPLQPWPQRDQNNSFSFTIKHAQSFPSVWMTVISRKAVATSYILPEKVAYVFVCAYQLTLSWLKLAWRQKQRYSIKKNNAPSQSSEVKYH